MKQVACYLCSLLHPLATTDLLWRSQKWLVGFEERNMLRLRDRQEEIIHVCMGVWCGGR